MNYKMLAADLDGTILDGGKDISSRNLAALRGLVERGVKVVICTGRMICAARPYWDRIEPGTPLVGYNGGLVQEPPTGENLLHKPVPADLVGEVLELCRRMRREVFGYWNDRMYVEAETRHVKLYTSTYGVEADVVADLLQVLRQGATKLLMPCEPSECVALRDEMSSILRDKCDVTTTEGRHVEILAKGVSKAPAVAFLAKRCGIAREEIAAIGDGFNDIEMLRHAGLGVAVANAGPEVKAAADRVVASNEEDGVAELIESVDWEGSPASDC